jgi:Histidine kinase-, DNA gyrase B-, and HSP90-like ATPase
MSGLLKRATFEIDPALEFFTVDELTMQLGHEQELWPLVLVKELVDNALDACEEAGVTPVIVVSIKKDSITVWDNGPGLPASTVERSLDYRIRVSNKTRYVSPTRGQLGNALKCVWAASRFGGRARFLQISLGPAESLRALQPARCIHTETPRPAAEAIGLRSGLAQMVGVGSHLALVVSAR